MWLSRLDNLHLPSLGTIRVIGVEVYGGNITATQDAKQIDWGIVYLGTLTNRSFYVRSLSNIPVTLTLGISDVFFQNSDGQNVTEAPPIDNPLILTWDYSNDVLLRWNDTIYVTLTLEISSDPSFIDYIINNHIERFGFVILIRTVEVE
jgi:hypothetical protein